MVLDLRGLPDVWYLELTTKIFSLGCNLTCWLSPFHRKHDFEKIYNLKNILSVICVTIFKSFKKILFDCLFLF